MTERRYLQTHKFDARQNTGNRVQ